MVFQAPKYKKKLFPKHESHFYKDLPNLKINYLKQNIYKAPDLYKTM